MSDENGVLARLRAHITFGPPLAGLAALPVLVWLGNPAFALLAAAAFALASDSKLSPHAPKVGKYALQTAIVLIGFRMDIDNLLALSADYSVLVGGYVVVVITLGIVAGRLLGIDGKLRDLIASGTAICGGTTIASLSPIIGARAEQTGVALALVFLLNAFALLAFPPFGEFIGMTQQQFGVWVSLAIHDTSSVVATAAIYGDEAAMVATTLKLGRTLWLIPLLLGFALANSSRDPNVSFPGFVLLFVVAAFLGSVVDVPVIVLDTVNAISKALLVIALFCIGTDFTRRTLSYLRPRELGFGVALWLVAVVATVLAALTLA